jgi:hypothetical protein
MKVFNAGDLYVLTAVNKILRLVFWDVPGTNILEQPAASVCNTEVTMETTDCYEMYLPVYQTTWHNV